MKQKKKSAFKATLVATVIAMLITYLFGRFLTGRTNETLLSLGMPVSCIYAAVSGIKAFLSMLIGVMIAYKAVYRRKIPGFATVLFSLLAGAVCGIVPCTKYYAMLIYRTGLPVELMPIVHLVFIFLVFFLLGLVLFAMTKPAVAASGSSAVSGISANETAAPVQSVRTTQVETPGYGMRDDEDDNNNNSFLKYK